MLRPPPMKDFFISFNKADRAWASWIAWQLEAEGYTTIFQPWDFRPGSNFVLRMQEAATQANRTIAVLTSDYLASGFTQPEWAAAFAKDPTGRAGMLVPVRVKECDLEGILPTIIYVDLVGLDAEAAHQTLSEGVRVGRAKPEIEPRFPGSFEHKTSPPPQFPGTPEPLSLAAGNRPAAIRRRLDGLIRQLTELQKSGEAVEYDTHGGGNILPRLDAIRNEANRLLASVGLTSEARAFEAEVDVQKSETPAQDALEDYIRLLSRVRNRLHLEDYVRNPHGRRVDVPSGTTANTHAETFAIDGPPRGSPKLSADGSSRKGRRWWQSLTAPQATLIAALLGAVPAVISGVVAYQAATSTKRVPGGVESSIRETLPSKVGFSPRVYPRIGLGFIAPDGWVVDDAAVRLGGGEIDVVKRYEVTKAAVGVKFRIRSVQPNYVEHHETEVQNELDPLLKVDPDASAQEVMLGGRPATQIRYKKPTGNLVGDVRYYWIRLDPRVKLEILCFVYTTSEDRDEFWKEVDVILSSVVVRPQEAAS